MLRVLGRARSVRNGLRGWVVIIFSVLLLGVLSGSSHANGGNSRHGIPWNDRGGCGTSSNEDEVVGLDPGESIKLSSLVGPRGHSLQIGDKLFDDFSVDLNDAGCDRADNLKPNTIWVTAISNSTGYGLSFTGPFTATGKNNKDLTIFYSVAVTDPNYLISDLHLSSTNAVWGKGFTSVVETVFTGKSCDNQIAQLEVFNSSCSNSDFQDSVDLTQLRQKLFVQQEIILGGGGLRGRNQATISSVDDIFSQTQIPEPSTMAMIITGLILLLLVTRRRVS